MNTSKKQIVAADPRIQGWKGYAKALKMSHLSSKSPQSPVIGNVGSSYPAMPRRGLISSPVIGLRRACPSTGDSKWLKSTAKYREQSHSRLGLIFGDTLRERFLKQSDRFAMCPHTLPPSVSSGFKFFLEKAC
jgi:hypothetical protein